jgi:hypothetical protein
MPVGSFMKPFLGVGKTGFVLHRLASSESESESPAPVLVSPVAVSVTRRWWIELASWYY